MIFLFPFRAIFPYIPGVIVVLLLIKVLPEAGKMLIAGIFGKMGIEGFSTNLPPKGAGPL